MSDWTNVEILFNTVRSDIHQMREDLAERLDRIDANIRQHDREIAALQAIAHVQAPCSLVQSMVRDVHQLQTDAATNRQVWKLAGLIGAGVAALVQVLFTVWRYLRGWSG